MENLWLTRFESRFEAIEAIEATRLPVITPGPCTRAPAGRRLYLLRRPLVAVVMPSMHISGVLRWFWGLGIRDSACRAPRGLATP